MAKIEFVGHRLVPEPWHESYEAAAGEIGPDAWFYPAEKLRHELLTRHEFHDLPHINGQQIHELQQAFGQARHEQAMSSASVLITKVLIVSRRVLLSLTEDPYLDEARATADEILTDVIGYKIPLKPRFENIFLGDMKNIRPGVYEHVKNTIAEIMPVSVNLGPLTGRIVIPTTKTKIEL